MASDVATPAANPFSDWMQAVSNQQGELNLHLDKVSLKLPYIPEAVILSGNVTLSFHLRELTPREREAHAAHSVRRLKD